MKGKSVQERALILKSSRYQERDQILTLLTEREGLLSALAKNSVSSRRFGGSLQLFTVSQIHLSLRNPEQLCMIQEATTLQRIALYDLKKLAFASSLTKLLIQILQPQHAVPDLFRLTVNALLAAEATSVDSSFLHLFNAFCLKLLQWGGHSPRLSSCLNCQSSSPHSERLFFFIAEAGWFCQPCFQKQTLQTLSLPLSCSEWMQLQTYDQLPIKRIPAALRSEKNLFSLLEALLNAHFQVTLHPFQNLPWMESTESECI